MTRRVTLTLDNGPDPELTPRVLDILAERSIRAVFFLVGRQIEAAGGQKTARMIVEHGHRVGNHTMTHGDPLGLRPDADAVQEIALADAALAGLAADPPLFRPNGGGELGPHVLSAAAAEYLRSTGHTVVTWTAVPRDWEEPAGSWVPRALDAVETTEHSVLVLHDIIPQTVERLAGFLDELTARGVDFVEDFPVVCVPIRAGEVLPHADRLIRSE
ncbi:polysaccharide deacetylase family protein [Saccharopolyspora sp. 5N708]|uniref:polysaccharide deacetylase family protein n=1 Tax=Saccharopolyspora sp. 5N708 TaxID=3457424 RepID=UPI003FCEFDC3